MYFHACVHFRVILCQHPAVCASRPVSPLLWEFPPLAMFVFCVFTLCLLTFLFMSSVRFLQKHGFKCMGSIYTDMCWLIHSIQSCPYAKHCNNDCVNDYRATNSFSQKDSGYIMKTFDNVLKLARDFLIWNRCQINFIIACRANHWLSISEDSF